MKEENLKQQTNTIELRGKDPLQIVLDNTTASVYVCDVDSYEIIFANKSLKSRFPYEVEGKKCWEALSNFGGPCPYCKLEEAKKLPLGQSYLWENFNPDMNQWLQLSQSILNWMDGRKVHLITFTDISDVKNNEIKLQEYKEELEKLLYEKTESEQKLQSINDNMPNAFSFQLVRRKGDIPRFLYASKGIENISGIPLDEVLNDATTFFEHVHAADMAKLNLIVNEEKPFIREVRYTNAITGELKYLVISEIPRQHFSDQIVWDGLAVNITERKKIETELHASQELLLKTDLVNQISNNMVNGAIYRARFEPTGRLSLDYVSNNIDKLSGGITAEEMQQDLSLFLDRIHPDEKEGIIGRMMHNNAYTKPVSLEFRYIRDNEVCWYKVQSIGSKQGNDVVHDGIILDITEQKQLEQDLIHARDRAEESDKLKSTFMANMSHEIRTPMNAILGFLELVFSEDILLDTDTRKEFVRIITDNAHQLMNLINDLLDISKLDAGQIKIVPKKDNLNVLLHDIQKSFITSGTFYQKEGMELILDKAGEDAEGVFTLDYFRLRQILNNIIGNAIKFTDKGYVKFGYDVVGQSLRFFVEDTGIGISKEKIADIGRPFHQLYDQSLAAQYGGTGIGLAISKNLISLMGGALQVTSEPGKGTRFEFSIPCNKISRE